MHFFKSKHISKNFTNPILNQFNANHETFSTHVTNNTNLVLKLLELVNKVCASYLTVLLQFFIIDDLMR